MIQYPRLLTPFLLYSLLLGLLTACAQPAGVSTAPTTADASATVAAPDPTATPTLVAENADTPSEAAAADAAAATGDSADESAERLVFAIVPEDSEVRFRVDELLFGEPKEVVGRTDAVSGTITVVPEAPAASQVGVIRVDARSLTTDDSFRNRSLRRFILESGRDDYQFVTFTPVQITGMPDGVAVGDTLQFEALGDLQIRDIVNPVTFAMTVTVVSETELTGIGRSVVLRPDFDLNIPDVPGVANVGEEVTLEIDFAARRTEE